MFRPEFRDLDQIERRRIVMPANTRLRLGRLEKPEPWPAEFRHLIAGLSWADLQQYPDYPPFYERLAAFNGIEPDEIVIGAGIEEFIRTLIMLCAAPGEKVAILWPTCAMFEIYARAFGVELVKIVTDPNKPLTDDDLIAQLPDDLRLLILPNPGQPVETCFGYGAMCNIARACRDRGAVLAVDEAYYGFGAPTMIPEHRHHDNMVVLRTFSKAFGAASIRLGYAVAGPKIKRTLDAVRQSGEVSAASMAIATLLMNYHRRFVAPSVEGIKQARDALRDRVQAELGFQAWGRYANHVSIELPDAARTAERLAQRGVYVKANFPAPVDRHLLVTCGSPDLMAVFFDELKACI